MRILIVGAGATGGYFGGRLAAAGRDVTFLVRPRRAAQLAGSGLVIRSPHGELRLTPVSTVLADAISSAFDLILLSCKAYDLDSAMTAFAPAVGAQTAILPLLNGMRHLDALDGRFGRERVLGGQCVIAAALEPDGTIVHLNDAHSITFGERDGGTSARVRAIAEAMADARFEARLSERVVQDMWEKWTFLAALAAGTCLMRASVGDILAQPCGRQILAGLLDECRAIAAANGHAPRPAIIERATATLMQPGSTLTASMLRDVERGGPTEADHILGDLLARHAAGPGAEQSPPLLQAPSLLQVAYAHLKAYEARRLRSGG